MPAPIVSTVRRLPVAAPKAARKAIVKVPVVSKQQKLAIASAAASYAAFIAPAAQAAQEVAMTAEGEAAIVQIGWGALAASFSLSLAMTVWGRAGL